MAVDIALIILLGLLANFIFTKLKLPGLLGMLLVGVIFGPNVVNIISPEILNISSDLRQIALIVILLRAGFEISAKTLKKIGKTSLLMSFIPAVLEGIAITFLANALLGISILEAAILGAILAAVSPAVVVPFMIDFIQRGKGKAREVPSIIIAASSVDDVFVIVIFSSLIGLFFKENGNLAMQILNIPISIILGMFLGLIMGVILSRFFRKFHMRDTKKVLIIVGLSILILWFEDIVKDVIPFAGLLSIMAIGVVILEKYEVLANRLGEKFKKIWVLAEIVLFVTIGAQVDISVIWKAGAIGVVIITIALIARGVGVYISLIGSDLKNDEKFFCMISYIPKATVQAAIGAIPLTLGVPSGDIILAIAVLSIVLTAPIGAIGIKYFGEKILK